MNMPSSLPASITDSQPSVPGRLGRLAQRAAPSLGYYLNIVRARKWLVLGITALIGLVTAIGVGLMTPIYVGTSTVLVEAGKSRIVSIEDIYGVPAAATREFFQTQAEFMKSREVGMRVVKHLNLATHRDFDPRQQEENAVIGWLRRYPFLTDVGLLASPRDQVTDERVAEVALSRYRRNLEIAPVRQSQLVEIRFESRDPVLAASVANQTARDYITADLDARFNMQQAAGKWLGERLEALKADLGESERKLQAYREEIGLIATPAASMGGNVRTLDASAERLLAARIDRAQAEQVYNQVSRNSANRYEVPAVFNNPAVIAARTAEAISEKRLSDAALSLGTQHPEYRSAFGELAAAKENTRRLSEGVIGSIAKQYEVARGTEKSLEKAVASSRTDIRDINRREGELNVLEREVGTNMTIYQTFLARVKETEATADFRNPVARVVDPAVPAMEPTKPRKSQLVVLALIMGSLLGSAVAIMLEQKAQVIRNSEEVLERLGFPLIVSVPKVDRKTALRLGRAQIDTPRSQFAESVRSALISVRLSMIDTPRPVIAFTSTLPGEGKSTIALNYALEQARTKRTLILDCDLRKPSIRGMLGIKQDLKGFSELFNGDRLEDCVQFAPELNLSILTSGALAKNPHDMLMSPRFAEIMMDLKLRFEVIVIDTTPLELVSDALPIGFHTDGMVYVVKAGETLAPMARRGLERIAGANIRVLGVVLNAHDFTRAEKYYGEASKFSEYADTYYGKSA